MTAVDFIAKVLNLKKNAVQNTVNLLDGGATIPFIARYRKEATQGLDEVQIADIQRQLTFFNTLTKRKETILKTIDEQGKLSAELKAKIEACMVESELEDLYLPYKPRRKTKADTARENGLEPLAKMLMSQYNGDVESKAIQFVKGDVKSVDEALEGARYIIAEWINENQITRDFLRNRLAKNTRLFSAVAKGKETEADKYKDYFAFDELLHKAPAHRILALFRAEKEGLLKLKFKADNEESLLEGINNYYIRGNSQAAAQVELAAKDAYKRLLFPSLETEMRQQAKERADKESITVFAKNLRNLLLEAPLGQKTTLAIDPGFRTGCKVVCLNAQGNLLHYETIYPHAPQNEWQKAAERLAFLINKYQIEAIAIGNGTAGRETEKLVRSIKTSHTPVVFVVSEDGASVYSASENGRKEFPDHDVTVRGAISIGRRLMDPLSELIKIDPKSLGIGQYQHDVDQKLLKQELDWVVESAVNTVGVNLNTASQHLLTYVSGLGPKLAENIIEYRDNEGNFSNRSELKKVKGLGPKAFEQAAGFLRISGGNNPLDNTGVHPERYALLKKILADHHISLADALNNSALEHELNLQAYLSDEVGLPTLRDILKELAKPGRDPREKAREFSYDPRLQSIENVQVGMVLPGLVSNVTNFGAFVDIGIKEKGLVHVSQLTDRYVSNPAEVVKLNQQVNVKVLEVDTTRKRIQLSMKDLN
ncbi:S1 RNA-binding domain-containing protein [bacterium]|nr:S1 RNA-binding domain-containing protein [bacterium]